MENSPFNRSLLPRPMMEEDMDMSAGIDTFMEWFQSNGGYVDRQVMGITAFPGSGRGAIALRDIPEGYTLFTLPRTLTLSTRTSPLPSLFGHEAWRTLGLHKGWVGLILCMMWEDAWADELDVMDVDGQGQAATQTKWGPYIRTLPTTFDTPMFWSATELQELQGTSVIDKLGRDEAERAFSEQLVPAIQTSPTLFPPSHHGKWYTLDAYHRAGSRILSRSFTVSRWTQVEAEENDNHEGEVGGEGSDVEEAEYSDPKTSIESTTRIDDDHPHTPLLEGTNKGPDSDSDDEEDHDTSDVAMVPMADLLNARWGSENAKLFYETVLLRMVTTKNIKQGEQIFNTYGDPPNSDLLRRYGHVDLVQLPFSSAVATSDRYGDVEMEDGGLQCLGNPSDIVEIRADLIVHVVQTGNFGLKGEDSRARIEWWLDEGEDDTIVLTLPEPGSHLSAILPPEFISLIRLLTLSEADFKNARSNGKLPKGKLKKTDEKDTTHVLGLVDDVLEQREVMYVGGSVEDDEHLLSARESFTRRKQHAVIVRLGEKRILRDVRDMVRMMLKDISSTGGTGCRSDTKRNQKGRKGREETESNKKRGTSGIEGDHGRKKPRK